MFVSYSQVTVFDPALEEPFNDWSDRHVAQGFAWRSGSVSFGTLLESGMADVQLRFADGRATAAEISTRAIEVPFSVPESGRLEVASIASSEPVSVEPGYRSLLFETWLPPDGKMVVRLTLAKESASDARVVKADPELAPTYPLLMEARPG